MLRARLCLGPRLCWQWAALLLLVRYGVVCAASAAPGARSSRPLRTPALLACASALLVEPPEAPSVCGLNLLVYEALSY
jgi:hypothetical protein